MGGNGGETMPGSKIVDEQEVKRWFADGWTAPQMIAEYQRKYGIETSPSMWGNFRRRHGLEPRNVRDADLIPWQVEERHRFRYPLEMLRLEAQTRAGRVLRGEDAARRESFLKRLAENAEVVEYRPETEEGFFYVARTSRDIDIIRAPRQARHAGSSSRL